MIRRLLVLLFPLMILAACDSVQFRQDENFTYLTITLSAQDTSSIIHGLLTGGHPPLMRAASVSLESGVIRVAGEVNDGRGGTVPGSLSLQLSSDGTTFRAAITEFRFAGFTADHALIERVNSDIARGLAQAAADNPDGSVISQVSVSPAGLQFTIRTPRAR